MKVIPACEALNYGTRKHGSNTLYGWSHFVLKDDFKVNAIYFPRDTFEQCGSDDQVSYQTLAAIYLKAEGVMRNDLWNACQGPLKDTDHPYQLIEAHIFDEVPFTAMSECRLSSLCSTGNYNRQEYQTYVMHAEAFCKKWGLKLTVVD
jgi:hypothetical protein